MWATRRGEFTPFGSPVNNNITTNNYKFTGQERDSESADFTGTGLDFMNARYYSSTLGRFTSPDPYLGSIHLWDPQSLNRYTYALNKPLSMLDPSGMIMQCAMTTQDYISTTTYSDDTQVTATRSQAVMDCTDDGEPEFGDALLSAPSYSGDTDASPTKMTMAQLAQCASKTANKFSIAGVLGWTEEGEGDSTATTIGKTVGTAFLGNTFSGIVDAGTHIYKNQTSGGNGNEVVGDWVLGGLRQGLPGGGPFSKGLVGIATEAAVNAIAPAGDVLSIAGAAAPLAEEGMAGPVGWAKLGIDLAIFVGSAISCASN